MEPHPKRARRDSGPTSNLDAVLLDGQSIEKLTKNTASLRAYECPFCHVTVHTSLETGEVHVSGHCGKQFRVRDGQVRRAFTHACPEMWHGGVFDHCPREAQIVAPATQWENMSRNALDREVMRPKTATRRSQINQPEKWMLESSSASDPKRQPNTSSTRAQTSQNRTQAWIADDGWSNCRQLQIRKDRNSSRIKALRRDFLHQKGGRTTSRSVGC